MKPDIVGSESILDGFIRSEQRYPARLALVTSTRRWTYEELGFRARQYAHAILDACGGRAERVGVFAYRTDTAYVGTLAALFSGAAFVPLNRTYPAQRTAVMAKAAALDALIVDAASAPQLDEVLCQLPRAPLVLLPDADAVRPSHAGARVLTSSDLDAVAPLEHPPAVMVDDMAYLLFTSGTTGTPKGVNVPHATVLHFLATMTRRFGIEPTDRFSQTFDQTFDPAVMDLFLAWHNGACIYAMSSLELIAPGRYINRNEITVWNSVPSIISFMRKKGFLAPDSLPTLRWSLFCGEQLPRQSAEAWLAAAPNSVVENLYGPTELTIVCLGHRWDPATSPALCENDMVPIGRPFAGNCVLVVDEALRPVADGEPGELCVAGQQTVTGYWQDPERTRERFVELPVSDYVTKRFYRTGDLVRRLANGEYICLGRVDHQVKVLGRRVELAEIESHLRRVDGIIDAVALGWPVDEEGRITGITAFVTGTVPSTSAVLDTLRRELPEYMVPRALHVLPQLPLNANGKTDRKALLAGLTA